VQLAAPIREEHPVRRTVLGRVVHDQIERQTQFVFRRPTCKLEMARPRLEDQRERSRQAFRISLLSQRVSCNEAQHGLWNVNWLLARRLWPINTVRPKDRVNHVRFDSRCDFVAESTFDALDADGQERIVQVLGIVDACRECLRFRSEFDDQSREFGPNHRMQRTGRLRFGCLHASVAGR
jgi:hypothetical protein